MSSPRPPNIPPWLDPRGRRRASTSPIDRRTVIVDRVFSVCCPYHETRVLLSPSNILEMEHRPGGVAVRYRCWCGHAGWHELVRAVG
jgi:hypothetical protein